MTIFTKIINNYTKQPSLTNNDTIFNNNYRHLILFIITELYYIFSFGIMTRID